MDLETMINLFMGYFEHYTDTSISKTFVVHESRNDFPELVTFLESNVTNKEWHISYNGLSFDAQVIHWILDNKARLLLLGVNELITEIYQYAQSIINRQNRNEFLDYPQWKMKIRQIDLFKLNHWDNPAKSSSLKWIQYSMDWYNVEEMPIHHTTPVYTQEDLQLIIDYCINDVRSTKEIMNLSKEQILLRRDLSKEYGIDLYSASEPRISKELFVHFLSEKLNLDKKDIKQRRTRRDKINLKDCILPYVSFKTPHFQKVLDFFKSQVITQTKGSLNYHVDYKGVRTDYGLGGLHGARESGIYRAEYGMIIMTSDVTSFYPNLAIKNGFAPAHLPKKEFLDQYEWFFEERKKIPKSDPKNYVYKIILNSSYGLSNDENSFLYDPLMTMQITINGQLLLSMLYEMICENIPGAVPLMQNTDGLETIIPAEYKDKYLEICAEWEKLTNLSLEHDEYTKLILADVNNYLAVNKAGKVKCKGRFEWEDLSKKKVASLHKNKSFLVIPKAIYEYFVNGVKPEDYLESNKNVFDYCGGVKTKGNWQMQSHDIEMGEHIVQNLQKLNRYYISNDGVKLVKVNPDGRKIQIESGMWKQTICNNITNHLEFEKLDINKNYYLNQIYKEIHNIDSKVSRGFVQMQLF